MLGVALEKSHLVFQLISCTHYLHVLFICYYITFTIMFVSGTGIDCSLRLKSPIKGVCFYMLYGDGIQ